MGRTKNPEKIQAEILIKAQIRSFSGPIRTSSFFAKKYKVKQYNFSCIVFNFKTFIILNKLEG
jgi:hypothetical protein